MPAPERPVVPPLICADLEKTGGRLGPEPEDFCVDELPQFPPSGSGDHHYIRLQKRRLTTPELISLVARAARVPEREVGSAGMKDKHAVTRQWLSLPGNARPASEWELPEGVEILEVSRHERKLRTGQLAGNRFRLRLVELPQGALERAQRLAERIRERGLINSFGSQRFGRGGENLVRAWQWLERGGQDRSKKARFYRKLYPSVIQSEIFNRYLHLRVPLGLSELLDGEVVRLDGSASVFVVDDSQRELPRLASRDIHLTGPMIGPKMKSPARSALELERAAASELELSEALLETLARLAPGTRRDLVMRPAGLEVTSDAEGQLLLEFTLPPGGYATELLRELTGNEDPRAGLNTG